MAVLTRDAILGSVDLVKELVAMPEWGGEVWVRSLTGAERDRLEAGMLDSKSKSQAQAVNLQNLRAKLAGMAMCDEDGKRLFSDADVRLLGEKNGLALNRVFDVARRLSGLAETDVKEMTEGLEADPTDGSLSA